MRTLRIVVLAVALAAAAGCGIRDKEAVAPATAPTQVASTTTMTREEAADYYLKSVKPYNKATKRCQDATKPFTVGGSYQGNELAIMAEVRKDCGKLAELNREQVDLFQQAAWPAEVQDAMNDLITYTQAFQFGLDQLAEAHSFEDGIAAIENMPQKSNAADLVRAHLGLPKRNPS